MCHFLWALCKTPGLRLIKPWLDLLNSLPTLPGLFHLIEHMQFKLVILKFEAILIGHGDHNKNLYIFFYFLFSTFSKMYEFENS